VFADLLEMIGLEACFQCRLKKLWKNEDLQTRFIQRYLTHIGGCYKFLFPIRLAVIYVLFGLFDLLIVSYCCGYSANVEIPTVEVRYENLKVEGEVYVGARALPTLANTIINFLEVSLRPKTLAMQLRDPTTFFIS
jgi:hypothetical protein